MLRPVYTHQPRTTADVSVSWVMDAMSSGQIFSQGTWSCRRFIYCGLPPAIGEKRPKAAKREVSEVLLLCQTQRVKYFEANGTCIHRRLPASHSITDVSQLLFGVVLQRAICDTSNLSVTFGLLTRAQSVAAETKVILSWPPRMFMPTQISHSTKGRVLWVLIQQGTVNDGKCQTKYAWCGGLAHLRTWVPLPLNRLLSVDSL